MVSTSEAIASESTLIPKQELRKYFSQNESKQIKLFAQISHSKMGALVIEFGLF